MANKPEAVLITGGAKRLGLAMARRCLELGYAVVIHYRSSPEPARRALLRKQAFRSRTFFVQHDLANQPEVLIDKVCELPIRLIGLVNNAAMFTQGNLHDPAHLCSAIDLNSITPVKLCSRFTSLIPNGWVINITDAHIAGPNARFQNYRISKQFLETLTRQLAYIHAPHFRINALAPGAMLPAEGSEKGYFESLAEKIPLKRTGDVKALLHAFEFLITNDYITGITVPVDGGWHLLTSDS